MSPLDAVKSCFQQYAVFSGRARRAEYWWWFVFNGLMVVVLSITAAGPAQGEGDLIANLAVLAWLGLLLPTLAVTVRRLHDTGRSGWWWFISLIPLIGPIILIVFLASAGDPGPNEYGYSPEIAVLESA